MTLASTLAMLLTALAPPVDSGLAADLASMARAMQSVLPMRQQTANGPITFESVEARLDELSTTMSVPLDLNQVDFGVSFAAAIPAQVCGNDQLSVLVRRGAKMTYVVRDSGCERFSASVSSCPAT